MRCLKTFATMFLATCLMVLTSASLAYAEDWGSEVERSEVLANAAVLLGSAYSENQLEVGAVAEQPLEDWALGAPIGVHCQDEGQAVDPPVSYWPLYNEDVIFAAIKTIGNSDGTTTFILTTELAEALENYSDDLREAVVVCDKDGVLSIARRQSEANMRRSVEELRGVDGFARLTAEGPLDSPDGDGVSSIRSEDIEAAMSLSAACVMAESVGEDSSDEEPSSGSAWAAYSAPSLFVPKLNQGQTPLCWAYSSASIGRFLTSAVTMTPEWLSMQIYGEIKSGGPEGVQSALSYYKYPNSGTSIASTVKSGKMDDWEIQNWISNGLPIYARTHVAGSNPSRNHGVVVCGWQKTSSGAFTVTVMNSGHGAYEIMMKNASGVLNLQYNSAGFQWNNGSVVLTGWQKPYGGSNWCWMRSNGTRERGWLFLGDSYYWFDSNGYMAESEWVKLDGKWYYLGSGGAMKTGWFLYGDYWYYLGSDGAARTGKCWIDGKRYIFDSNGAMHTGWHYDGSYWFYLGSDGAARTGWQSIGGEWFVFDGNGAMYRGWYKDGSTWYYLRTASGVPSGGSEGSMLAGGTWTINGKAYRFDPSGACLNP